MWASRLAYAHFKAPEYAGTGHAVKRPDSVEVAFYGASPLEPYAVQNNPCIGSFLTARSALAGRAASLIPEYKPPPVGRPRPGRQAAEQSAGLQARHRSCRFSTADQRLTRKMRPRQADVQGRYGRRRSWAAERSAASATSTGTMVMPMGQRARAASFTCCKAKGMPMIVMAH